MPELKPQHSVSEETAARIARALERIADAKEKKNERKAKQTKPNTARQVVKT